MGSAVGRLGLAGPPRPVGASPVLAAVSCASPTFCVAVGSTHAPGRQYVAGFLGRGSARAVVEVWNGTAPSRRERTAPRWR